MVSVTMAMADGDGGCPPESPPPSGNSLSTLSSAARKASASGVTRPVLRSASTQRRKLDSATLINAISAGVVGRSSSITRL
jgi:hypothetical protein